MKSHVVRAAVAPVFLAGLAAIALAATGCETTGGSGGEVVQLGPSTNGTDPGADADATDSGADLDPGNGGGGAGGTDSGGADLVADGGGTDPLDTIGPDMDMPEPTDDADAAADVGPPCEPSCEAAECGSDGCGGSCGSCSADTPYCNEGVCEVEQVGGAPALQLDPTELDFGYVADGFSSQHDVLLHNVGAAPLIFFGLSLAGDPGFSVSLNGQTWTSGGEEVSIAFSSPLEIAAGEHLALGVEFTGAGAGTSTAGLVLFTDDPVYPEGAAVSLSAASGGPCLSVAPAQAVDFGGVLVGKVAAKTVELVSCGTDYLTISSVEIEGNVAFSLEVPQQPVSLAPGAKMPVEVDYLPSKESPYGPDGQLQPDTATVVIASDAPGPAKQVPVSGVGVTVECPTAVIVVQEGEQVIPQTNLHLFGDQSFAPTGNIVSWEWSVAQPAGSASVFFPSASYPNPTFEVNVAGVYTFQLRVWDEVGAQSCVTAEYIVQVIPGEAIHVELLWDTPGDPDQTDQGMETGADMDLHFAHAVYAVSGPDIDGDGLPDPWFDQPFDCFWFNAHPNWGSFDPSIDDDPGLDLDDTDGAGPENVNVNIPEATTYVIGVHYWSDHDYGPSYATVRVYIYSELVFEVSGVKMVNHDMWEVGTLSWPSGQITQKVAPGGGHKITPNYQNPFFFRP